MNKFFIVSIAMLLTLTACSAGQVGIDATNQSVQVQQGNSSKLGLNESVINETNTVSRKLTETLSVIEGATVEDVLVLPVPVANNNKYALAVKLSTDRAEINSVDTVKEVLRITRETAVIEPLSYSVLIEYNSTLTNYVWRSASDLWESNDITAFAGEPMVIDPDVERVVYVTFTADWQACPRMSSTDCPVFIKLPKGTYAVVNDQTNGQRVEGSSIWYISSYFGIPAYVPFTRVSGT